jgi:membrane protein YdbS with pleckstrin-like domain
MKINKVLVGLTSMVLGLIFGIIYQFGVEWCETAMLISFIPVGILGLIMIVFGLVINPIRMLIVLIRKK